MEIQGATTGRENKVVFIAVGEGTLPNVIAYRVNLQSG
jgi:hypothetical protein